MNEDIFDKIDEYASEIFLYLISGFSIIGAIYRFIEIIIDYDEISIGFLIFSIIGHALGFGIVGAMAALLIVLARVIFIVVIGGIVFFGAVGTIIWIMSQVIPV